MADRDRYEGYGSDRDRWRDRERDHAREAGWRVDDERRSWSHEDYGRGRHHEGGTYGQGAGQRSLQHEDQRYGAHRGAGETWGQSPGHRDQTGREDFGHYGQTGAGGDYGHERHGGGGLDQTYGQSGDGERERSGQGDYGPGREGRGRQGRGRRHPAGEGMTLASTHADFEPDYLHWRNTQMQKLDQEYLRWREERRSKFAKDFDEWRRTQGGRQEQHFPTGPMQTAGQGSSGGVFPDQAGGREDKKKS